MTGGAIGLAMGIAGVVTSLFFVGQKLLEISTKVSGLEFLGDYGSAVLAFAAVAIYVPLNTLIALKLGRLLERLTVRMQQAEGSYRGELTTLFRRSFHVAASRGEGVQRAMHDRLYRDIDRTWAGLNKINAGYMSFELIYNFVAARIVAYGPSLVPYMQNAISLKGYVTGAELVNSLISQCSWFIHVMPEIATLQGQCKARDRSRRSDRERAAAARFLPPQRPFRLPLRHPECRLRPEDPESRADAPGQRCGAVPQGGEPALPARRVDLREGRLRLRQDLAGQGDQRAVAIRPRHHRLPRRGQDLLCRAGRQAAARLAEGAGLPAVPRRATIRTRRSRRRFTSPASAISSSTWPTTPATERAGTRSFQAARSRS